MGYSGPPNDTRGDGSIISPEEHAEEFSEREPLEAPSRVADHVRRTR